MTLAESHFHAAKTQRKGFDNKSCTRGLMVSRPAKNRIFKPPKCRICDHRSPRNLCAEFLRKLEKTYFQANKMKPITLERRIFRPSKYRRVNQRKQDTLDPRPSWPLKNNIFRWPKSLRGRHECRRLTQRKQDTLDPRLSWTLKNKNSSWPKCVRGWHAASYPGVKDFRKGISTNNYGGTMSKNIYLFSKY
jgi:hypothetical protein